MVSGVCQQMSGEGRGGEADSLGSIPETGEELSMEERTREWDREKRGRKGGIYI